MRAAILLALAGCGLGPQPDFDRDHSTTGIAPWREIGAATICDGTHALDEPGAVVGGLCLSPLTPGTHACSVDRDCGSREACVCNTCVVPYCRSNLDCEPDRTCDFATNRCDQRCEDFTDCAAGEDCLNGSCRGRCATSEECQHGEVCDRTHVCITDACTANGDCFPGETCEVQREPRAVVEPSPVLHDGELSLFLELPGGIYRAVGTDARHFVLDAAPILPNAHSPSVAGSTLAYEFGGEIQIVDIVDLDHPSSVVATIPNATQPGVVAIDHGATESYLVYYIRGGAIGLYDLGANVDRGIVLSPTDVQVGDPANTTSAFWSPVTRLASPHAVIAGPPGVATIHLYFSAFGQESATATKFGNPEPIPPNYSIGYAAAALDAPDVLAVWPYGPIADHVEVFLEHHDELTPSTIQLPDGSWRMYYLDATRDPGIGEQGPFTLGRVSILGLGDLAERK